jgi:hypothetical protein
VAHKSGEAVPKPSRSSLAGRRRVDEISQEWETGLRMESGGSIAAVALFHHVRMFRDLADEITGSR